MNQFVLGASVAVYTLMNFFREVLWLNHPRLVQHKNAGYPGRAELVLEDNKMDNIILVALWNLALAAITMPFVILIVSWEVNLVPISA